MPRLVAVVVLAACASSAPRPSPPSRDLDVHEQPTVVEAALSPVPEAGAASVTPEAERTPDAEPATIPPAPPPPVAAPAVPNVDTLARFGWPATTTSFVLHNAAHVYPRPDMNAEPLGKIIASTRMPVGESVDGDKRCKHWLAVLPTGWICGRYARASTQPPEALVQPIVPDGNLLPEDYYGIKKGAKRYATVEDVRAGLARPEPKEQSTYMVTKDEKVDVDGEPYVKTSVGLVAASDLYKHWPSAFAGIDLIATPPPAWPFAWVNAANRRSVTARAEPTKKAAAAGELSHREVVPVLEETDRYVRVGEGQWLERSSVRIARQRPRPAVDDAHRKWIDVDRDEQVMIAYDGDTPVFATLVSTGRRANDTPPALYRIRSKSAVTKMAAEEREAAHYEVSEVPWATRFRSGLYFHAAYWHDRFGNVQSHGCVNLSPRDARWVYDWTEPTMPAGWNELEIAVPGSMVVRVVDAKHPDPPVFDYEKEAKERVKIRKREEELKKKRLEAEAAAAAAAANGGSPAP